MSFPFPHPLPARHTTSDSFHPPMHACMIPHPTFPQESGTSNNGDVTKVIIQLTASDTGEATGPQLELPVDTSPKQLRQLINELLQNDESLRYAFFVKEDEIVETLSETLTKQKTNLEVGKRMWARVRVYLCGFCTPMDIYSVCGVRVRLLVRGCGYMQAYGIACIFTRPLTR